MKRQWNIRAGVSLAIAAMVFLFREALIWLWDRTLDLIPTSWVAEGKSLADRIAWANILALIVLGVGITMFVRGSRQSEEKSEDAKTEALWTRAQYVTTYIARYRATKHIFRSDLPSITPIIVDGASLIRSLEKAGYAVPSLRFDSAEETAVCLEQYLTVLYPLLRDGHIEDARNDSAALAEAAMQNAKRTGVADFWTHTGW